MRRDGVTEGSKWPTLAEPFWPHPQNPTPPGTCVYILVSKHFVCELFELKCRAQECNLQKEEEEEEELRGCDFVATWIEVPAETDAPAVQSYSIRESHMDR